jgi:hypothetical protein
MLDDNQDMVDGAWRLTFLCCVLSDNQTRRAYLASAIAT